MKYTTGQVLHFDLCATFQVAAPAGDSPRRSEHAGWEFTFSASNSPQLRLRSQSFSPTGSNVLLYNGLEPHEELFPEDKPSSCHALVIFSRFIESILSDYDINPKEVLFDRIQIEKDHYLISNLKRIMNFRNTPEVSKHAFDALLTETLLHVLTEYPHSHSRKLVELRREARFPTTVAKAKQVISRRAFDEDFSLDELASSVGMSKFHLIQTFKRATGLSPFQYRNKIRIDAAKHLLVTTSCEVGKIAEVLGYRDISTFNKSFKKASGTSPLAFRSTQKPQ